MEQIDLGSDEVIKGLYKDFVDEINVNWLGKYSEFLIKIRRASTEELASPEYQLLLWEKNPVSSSGASSVSTKAMYSPNELAEWIANLQKQELPQDILERIKSLQFIYSKLESDFRKISGNKSSPWLRFLRIMAVFFPHDISCVTNRGFLQKVSKAMLSTIPEGCDDDIGRNVLLMKRLNDVLGEVGDNPEDLAKRSIFVWYLYGKLKDTTVNKSTSFESHFDEFIVDFLETDKGNKHKNTYAEIRAQAQKNYMGVIEAIDRGEDTTDMVLETLLPYANSISNSAKGVWIHIAPVISNEIRSKFQGANWTKPEDWPQVATCVFKFIKSCIDRPEDLDSACKIFIKDIPSKGFQMGTLTPILNALRPDLFLMINNKPRQVINFFGKNSFGNGLEEYPAINERGFELLETYSECFEKVATPEYLICDVFDTFCHWMVSEKKFRFKDIRVFKIAPGEQAKNWDSCRDEGYIGIGWNDFGDVSKLTKGEFTRKRDELIERMSDWTKKGANQVWAFANIREGDRVIANRGTTEVLGIGTVTGPYYFVSGVEYCHRLPILWDDLTPRRIDEPSWVNTLRPLEIKKYEEILSAPTVEPIVPPPVLPLPSHLNPEFPLELCAEETGTSSVQLKIWITALRRKGQAIFYGPPGTGKTFLAERIAKHLIGGTDGITEIVQFHPEYAYQDFMQGIRPISLADGTLRYDMVPGIFQIFCEEASHHNSNCVLIIDEINRANLSRVFGELMYLLEYRDAKVRIPGGKMFSIPKNVLIIGTMNTADRSIALVDYALRRRFAFLRLSPNYDVLRKYHRKNSFQVDGLINVLKELNAQINDFHYEIGISFFLRKGLQNEIEQIWKLEIEPYIEEYFFDNHSKASKFSWDEIASKIYS